jgi:hypothetical protein
VELRAVETVVDGYGAASQAKWAAWRRKNGAQDLCEELLDDQMRLIAHVLNPMLTAD